MEKEMFQQLCDFNIKDFIHECAFDESIALSEIDYIRLCFTKLMRISEYMNFQKFNDSFMDTCVAYNDENGELEFKFSIDEFKRKLKSFLELPFSASDDDLKARLRDFKYAYYDSATKNFISSFDSSIVYKFISKKFNDGDDNADVLRNSDPSKDQIDDELNNCIYQCDFRHDPYFYRDNQVFLYQAFLSCENRYKTLIDKVKPKFKSLLFDQNKIDLYLANRYFELLSSCDLESGEVSKYCTLLSKFFSEGDKGVSLYDGKLTYLSLFDKYIYFLTQNNLVELLFLLSPVIVKGKKGNIEGEKSNTGCRFVKGCEDLTKYIDNNNRKIRFYNSCGALCTCVGVYGNINYSGFILPNGYVICDKVAMDSKGIKSASDNGTYVIDIDKFEEYCYVSKMNLRKLPGVHFIAHSKSWEDRLQRYIDVKPTEKTIKEANELILRLRKKVL